MFLPPVFDIQMVQYAPGRISNVSIISAIIPQMAQEANFKGQHLWKHLLFFQEDFKVIFNLIKMELRDEQSY